jgi:hypothetical protein
LNRKSVESAQRKAKKQTGSDAALKTLMDEFKPRIEDGEVFLLKTLRERYDDLRKQDGISPTETIRAHYFKDKLIQSFPSISFVQQIGFSDLVCSSNITVGDALLKAQSLLVALRSHQENVEDASISEEMTTDISDEAILHRAIGLLRRDISESKGPEGEYFSCSEISLEAEKQFVSPLLYKALVWMTDEKLYRDAAETEDLPLNARCLHVT